MTLHPTDDSFDDGEHADVAARLRASLTAPSLDPAVRARHLQAIRDRATAVPPVPQRVAAPPRAGRRLAATLSTAGLVLVISASGAVAASQSALPGELLYPVKGVSEQVILALPIGGSIQRHVAFADRRLDEADQLTDQDAEPALIAEAIVAHARLMSRAGELAESEGADTGGLQAAAVVARQRLVHLLEQGLPPVAADQARAALSAIDARLNRPSGTPPSAPGLPDDLPGRPDARPGPPVPGSTAPAPVTPATPGPPTHAPGPGQPGTGEQPQKPRPVPAPSPQAPVPAQPPAEVPAPGASHQQPRSGATQGAPAQPPVSPPAGSGPPHDGLVAGASPLSLG